MKSSTTCIITGCRNKGEYRYGRMICEECYGIVISIEQIDKRTKEYKDRTDWFDSWY